MKKTCDVEFLKNQFLKDTYNSMNFTEEEWAIIGELVVFKEYKKGTVLLRAGQFSTVTYFLIKGCLRSYYLVDGEEKLTSFYTENENFTPSCAVTNKPAEHYLDCLEDCLEDCLVSIGTPESEKKFLEKFPRFEKTCRIFAEELLNMKQSEFDSFRITSPELRYRNFAAKRPDLIQRIPQYQIASYLGLTPQSLSRIRRRLLKSELNTHKVAS